MYRYKFKKGFSLVEALVSMLVIALVFTLAVPFITKKIAVKELTNRDFQGFYYENRPSQDVLGKCVIATSNNNGGTSITLSDSTRCQAYEFVVPKKVTNMDITLVAGGGGGGGASGGITYEERINSSNKNQAAFVMNFDIIKKIVIDYMIGQGEAGQKHSGAKPGNGGKSGWAIVNHEITRSDLFSTSLGNNLTQTFKTSTATISPLFKVGVPYLDAGENYFTGKIREAIFGIARNTAQCSEIEHFIKSHENAGTCDIYYRIAAGSYESSSGFSCKYRGANGSNTETDSCANIPASSRRSPEQGGIPPAISTNTKINNVQASGGEGGFIKEAGQVGSGGIGASIKCNGSTCSPDIGKTGGKEGGAAIRFIGDFPGRIGAGGGGGVAIKLKDFPVKPGEKYTIYVGSGGAGGAEGKKGLMNEIIAKVNEYSSVNAESAETAGTNGVGGTSTAMYDEEGNLVVMVLGGFAGYRGDVRDGLPASGNYLGITSVTSIYNSGKSVPEFPMIYIGKSYKDAVSNHLDTDFQTFAGNIMVTVNISGDNQFKKGSSTLKRLIYNSENHLVPSLLSSNLQDIYRKNNSKPESDDKFQGLGSFVNYETSTDDNNNNSYIYKTPETATLSIYNGFYARYLNRDEFVYAGGLGGFSGLGTKTGCGGGFVGNLDGKAADGNSSYKGTFILGANNKSRLYSVNTYFDNCNINSPNGQTAEFIAPSISSVEGKTLGQAGAGGGGGGWSSEKGAGRGGRGQDGYAFIDWKRP